MIENNSINKLAAIFLNLFLLIPTLGILGPLLPDLLISLTVIFFFILIIKFHENNFLSLLKSNEIFLWSVILAIYLILNSIINFSSQDDFSFQKIKSFFSRSLFFFRFILYPVAIIYLIKNFDLVFNKNIVYFSLLSILFVNFDTIYQYIFGIDIFGFKPIEREDIALGRLSGPFGDELIPGGYLLKYLFTSLTLIFFVFKYKYKNIILFFIFINFLTILLSGERSALLLCGLGITIFFLFFKDFRKKLYLVIISLLIVIPLILSQNPILKKRVVDQTLFNAGLSSAWGKKDGDYLSLLGLNEAKLIDSHYGAHWEVAFKIWEDNKLIGIGLKQFREKCSDSKYDDELKSALKSIRCATHPHNQYFEIISETGIIGLFITLMLFFKILKYCRKYMINSFEVKLITISIILVIWPIIPTGSIFTNHKLTYISYLITFLLICSKFNFSKLIKWK